MKRLIKAKQEILGMARIGYLGKKDKQGLEVYINTDDNGDKPHVHVRHKDNWDEFHTCIRLDTAEYFLHDGKRDTFNSGQKKLFVQFMNTNLSGRFTGSIWDYCIYEWNRNNERHPMDENIQMPDYNSL